MGVIYKTTNLINGKIYIVKRIFSKDKFMRTNYYGSGKLFKQSISKYVLENFVREIIEEIDNNLLCEREIFWIKHTIRIICKLVTTYLLVEIAPMVRKEIKNQKLLNKN
jgi:hypothetical protein